MIDLRKEKFLYAYVVGKFRNYTAGILETENLCPSVSVMFLEINDTIIAFLICIQLFACNKNDEMKSSSKNSSGIDGMKLRITIGSNTFIATIYKNATATSFKAKLPLTIYMKELNGNENFFDLSENLPTNASNGGTIQSGDLMLYGSNTLVLFYNTFLTAYSYTKVARIDDPSCGFHGFRC